MHDLCLHRTAAARRSLRHAVALGSLFALLACGAGQPSPSSNARGDTPAAQVAAVAAAVRPVAATPRLRGPHLRLDDTLWEWGVVPAGQELRHLFTLRNDGDAPVRIKKARTTCSCTAASFDREIPPGGTGTMEVVVNGSKLHHGKSTVYLDIETNDPRSDTTLVLRGEVVPAEHAGIQIDAGLLIR